MECNLAVSVVINMLYMNVAMTIEYSTASTKSSLLALA